VCAVFQRSVYRFYRWGSIAPARTRGSRTLGRRSRTPRSAPHYLVRSGTIHRLTAVGRWGREEKSGLDDSVRRLHRFVCSTWLRPVSRIKSPPVLFFFQLKMIPIICVSYCLHKQRDKLIHYSPSQFYLTSCILTTRAWSWLWIKSTEIKSESV